MQKIEQFIQIRQLNSTADLPVLRYSLLLFHSEPSHGIGL